MTENYRGNDDICDDLARCMAGSDIHLPADFGFTRLEGAFRYGEGFGCSDMDWEIEHLPDPQGYGRFELAIFDEYNPETGLWDNWQEWRAVVPVEQFVASLFAAIDDLAERHHQFAKAAERMRLRIPELMEQLRKRPG